MALKMEYLIVFGIILIYVGLFTVFLGILKGAKETKVNAAVGGFIGPIPFGFGTDKNLVWFVTILSIVLFLVWIFFSFRLWK